MERTPDMAHPVPIRNGPASLPDLVFCSPDRARAQSVIMRLRGIGRVTWESAASPALLASRSEGSLVLLDFAEPNAQASADFARELTRLAPGMVLVAVGNSASSAGVLAALRAGVRDFIDLDAGLDEAEAVISRALRQRGSAPTLTPVARFQGRTILLLGARAGVGTSTLAAHLGSLVQEQRSAGPQPAEPVADHVLLLDLGQPGGDAALYLDVRGEFDVAAAIDNAHRFDATLARTALARHSSELAVLSQPIGSGPAGGDSEADIALLVDRLRGFFEILLVDLGGLPARTLSAPLLRLADEIWIVVDQGVASMVSLDDLLQNLRRCGADRQRMQLVVNRHDDEAGLDPRQIAERFQLPLLATLPDRGRALRGSANLGKLLHETAPRDRYVRALQPLLDRLQGASTATTAPASGLRSLFTRPGEPRWKRT
jgi:pilus assembly protein CpaE